MNIKLSFCIAIFPLLTIYGQIQDSSKIFYTNEVVVFGSSQVINKSDFPMGKSSLSTVLGKGGLSLIRKGVFFAQDIYGDGLKRGDFSVVIDGERYHNACPMRMDAPITRINPLEISNISMMKSSDELQSGLGGLISIHRARPSDSLHVIGSLTQATGSLKETDIAFLSEYASHRFSVRYTSGLPYTAGNGKTFKDLYGYKDETRYHFAEAAFSGFGRGLGYTASFMYTGDVVFPYQQMDEKRSSVYNASISYGDIKLYANYTSHLMNNSLRQSSMIMETDARNTTIGITGKWFELYYRGWSADNYLSMTSMGNTMRIDNHILPDISQFSTNLHYAFMFPIADISTRIGAAHLGIDDSNVLGFYETVQGKSESKRFFITGALSVGKKFSINNDWMLLSTADVVIDSPEPEALFIKVQRFSGKPFWSGNPSLQQPVRGTVRSRISFGLNSLEVFGSFISNYVYPQGKVVGTQKYQTFGNINALIAGAVIKLNYSYLESEISYLYGENKTADKPLTEVLPMQIKNRISMPEIFNMHWYILHTYENAMGRVDRALLELPSKAWNSVELGMRTQLTHNLLLQADLENLFNHTFARHLSYVRDPFASGYTILEPGTTLRVNLRYIY